MSFETGGAIALAWKKREGLLAHLPKLKKWEQRWIVLGDGQLRYYDVADAEKLGDDDLEARGVIDLLSTKTTVQVCAQPSHDAPTMHEVDIVSEPIVDKTAAVAATVAPIAPATKEEETPAQSQTKRNPLARFQEFRNNRMNNNPTANAATIDSTDPHAKEKVKIMRWKLCFETQLDLVEFLEKAHAILELNGQLKELDSNRFEHDFLPGTSEQWFE